MLDPWPAFFYVSRGDPRFHFTWIVCSPNREMYYMLEIQLAFSPVLIQPPPAGWFLRSVNPWEPLPYKCPEVMWRSSNQQKKKPCHSTLFGKIDFLYPSCVGSLRGDCGKLLGFGWSHFTLGLGLNRLSKEVGWDHSSHLKCGPVESEWVGHPRDCSQSILQGLCCGNMTRTLVLTASL